MILIDSVNKILEGLLAASWFVSIVLVNYVAFKYLASKHPKNK